MAPQVKKPPPVKVPQSMNVSIENIDFAIRADGDRIRLIEVIPDQIITRSSLTQAKIADGLALSDPQRDILKIAVVDRHTSSGSTGKAFVRGLGLKKGAIASSVAHDSHNIIVAGADDGDGGPPEKRRPAGRPEHRRRRVDLGQERRIVRLAEQDHGRAGGVAGGEFRLDFLRRAGGIAGPSPGSGQPRQGVERPQAGTEAAQQVGVGPDGRDGGA